MNTVDIKNSREDISRYMTQIEKSSLFCTLSRETVEGYILPAARVTQYAKQEYIYTPMETGDRLGIILSGTVHIMNLFSDGGYSLMSVLSAPKVVGGDLIFTGSRRPPYYAVCATAVTVLSFSRSLFTERGGLPESDRAEIVGKLLTVVSQENMQKYYRIAILSQKGLRQRVLTYLSMQAQKRGTNTFNIPFSREEMAAFLCVNRSALSHELSLMKQEGLIDFRKKSFTLMPKGEVQGTWWKEPNGRD